MENWENVLEGNWKNMPGFKCLTPYYLPVQRVLDILYSTLERGKRCGQDRNPFTRSTVQCTHPGWPAFLHYLGLTLSITLTIKRSTEDFLITIALTVKFQKSTLGSKRPPASKLTTIKSCNFSLNVTQLVQIKNNIIVVCFIYLTRLRSQINIFNPKIKD